MTFLASTIGKIVAGLALVVIVLGLFQVRSCHLASQRAAETRLQRSQTEALGNSAQDAIGTVRASGEAERESEELTRTNEKEIRDAQGADAAVDPAVRDAGLRALCRRPAYRDTERCRLFLARASGMATGR